MNPFALSGLLTGLFAISLSLFSFLNSRNRRLGKIWGLFNLAVAGWGFWGMGFGLAQNPVKSMMAWRLCYGFGTIWLAPIYYHFVCVFLEEHKPHTIRLHYVVAGMFCLLLPAPIFFRGLRWVFNSFYYTVPGPIFFVFFIWWVSLVIYGHYVLARTYPRVSDSKKQQIKYFFIATAIGYTGGTLCYLPNFNIDWYPYGNFAVPVYIVIMAYAILKHRLMDVKIVIRKTLVYSLVSAALAAIYVGTITLLAHYMEGRRRPSSALSSALGAIFITLLFNPLRLRTQRWMDRHFPRERLDRELLQEAAGGFAHEMKRPLSKITLPAELTLMDLERVKNGEKTWEEFLPQFEQRLRYIISQSIDAGHTIEAIRELSAASTTSLVSVDLRQAMERALLAEKEFLEKSGISVRLHWPGDLPAVQGRPRQFEIVFVNLIKNAAEAMRELPEDAPKEIHIDAQKMAQHVQIRFRDSGPGFRPEDRGKFFQPQYTTKGSLGTGMGLYLSSQIMQANGGSIEISSEPEHATEFSLRFSWVEK